VAVARRADRLGQLKSLHPARCVPVAGDITDPAVHQQVVQAVAAAGDGRLDLLVNNAGVGAIGPFAQASPERLRRVMEVNFFAPVELTRALLPQLLRGRAPVICNICSVLGHRAVANKSEYCASKFALHGWSDALRTELYPAGIQVTLVSPSTTASDFFDSLIDTADGQRSASLGSCSPQRVARAALAAIRARRSEVICSLPGKALVYADRLCPPIVNAVLRQRRG
jgi:short-subunit dehydrogenase